MACAFRYTDCMNTPENIQHLKVLILVGGGGGSEN